jgi:hypothetical protein
VAYFEAETRMSRNNQGEDRMKLNFTIVLAATFLMGGIAEAQIRTVTRIGPNGEKLILKLDGKYSTCVRDSQRLGYFADSAKRYCDAKPSLTR